MLTKPSDWTPVHTTKVVTGEQFIPTGVDYIKKNIDYKGLGRSVIINDNTPTGPTHIDMKECIVSFKDDKLDAQGIPVTPIDPNNGKLYDQKWGVRSYDWEGKMKRVEFRNIKKEHGDYETTSMNRTWEECYFHDIGSQGIQVRPDAPSMHLLDSANQRSKHLVDNCLFYRCGNPWGSRPSHTAKWFAFEKLNGSFVPSKTGVFIKNSTFIHPGGIPFGYQSKYESYGAIFAQDRPIVNIKGGSIDYVKPNYSVIELRGIKKLVIDGMHIPRGDNVIQLANMDDSDIEIVNCTGKATIKMGHFVNGVYKPDVFKGRPLANGFVQ